MPVNDPDWIRIPRNVSYAAFVFWFINITRMWVYPPRMTNFIHESLLKWYLTHTPIISIKLRLGEGITIDE